MDCKVTVGGRLKANKGVNTPDVLLAMSPITDKDGLESRRSHVKALVNSVSLVARMCCNMLQ